MFLALRFLLVSLIKLLSDSDEDESDDEDLVEDEEDFEDDDEFELDEELDEGFVLNFFLFGFRSSLSRPWLSSEITENKN